MTFGGPSERFLSGDQLSEAQAPRVWPGEGNGAGSME